MSHTEYQRAVRLALEARAASEAKDARQVAAPLPRLTDDQCAAVDDQAGLL